MSKFGIVKLFSEWTKRVSGRTGTGLIKIRVWSVRVISGFSAPLLAPLVSDGSLLSSSSSILETLDGLLESLSSSNALRVVGEFMLVFAKKNDRNDVLISESDEYGTLIQSNITCFSTSMKNLIFDNFGIIFRIFNMFVTSFHQLRIYESTNFFT